ncbi:hypothetical protein J6K59_01335 [Leuconostoc mesenteroides]|uniref:hypothetical protein n=1 Tax=Leuconostoc mesenteroides TaxID=1245 RepID=UPI001CC114FE|nr:hypothetical protein [Leuconostoc mesenteroides]MBZ1505946.1 hypothetical protein [Leuconostoc mesenteroides]
MAAGITPEEMKLQLNEFENNRTGVPEFGGIHNELQTDDPNNAVRKDVARKYSDAVNKELDSKGWYRKFLIIAIVIIFSGITIMVFIAIFDTHISDAVKLSLIGGFFTNFIGLLIIVFKYAFSRTSELYKAISDLIGK